jgi:hypothetical protein
MNLFLKGSLAAARDYIGTICNGSVGRHSHRRQLGQLIANISYSARQALLCHSFAGEKTIVMQDFLYPKKMLPAYGLEA